MPSILHRSIGAFRFFNHNLRVFGGSGVLLSKNIVLTVAHNLYDKNRSSATKKKEKDLKKYEYDRLRFRFYNGEILGQNYYEIEDWRYLPEFLKSPNDTTGYKFDYALVKLKTKTEYD
jgi:hypothetical protein